MRIRELSAEECIEILARSDLGRLACAHNGQPYVVPIHFSFDRVKKCLYAISTVGQKILWMRENPKVCVEIEEIADKNHWTTVVLFGRYDELQESSDEAEARSRAHRLFEQRPEWWLPALGKTGSRDRHAALIYRIWIDRMSGRSASRGIVGS